MNPSSSSTSLVPYSSSIWKRPKYDVFVNYSYEDTGNRFVSHFKAALDRHCFNISDHKTLPIGQDESSELLKTIEDSQICVVVFSTRYAVSNKCLDVLVLIMDSVSKFKDRRVFPVFLNVDPSDVKNQRGCFEEAFRTHEANVDPERVHKWKQALKDAGHRSGLTLENADEAEFIQKVVQQLKKIQLPEKLSNEDHLVGIEPRAQALISKLRLGDQDFSNILAVLGISGSGKTTIVKAVYDRIVADFNFSYFIENVHNRNKSNWKFKLQREVLRGLTGNDQFYNVGAAHIEKFITNNKALLVVDDVEKFEELQALGIPWASLDSGSRIIVTTRNKRSLGNLPYTSFKISLLNGEESFKLFTGFAYGEDDFVDETFVEEIVLHAGGLPLVLEVWGLHFKAHDKKLWPNLLETLKRIPHEDIQMKLRVSYDSLGERAKKLFLDIACFFDDWLKPEMLEVLEDHNTSFYPQIELQVLLDRGLVGIRDIGYDKVLTLHHLIRKMGEEVVRQENEDEPGQRTRLTGHRDVLHVLENNSGTDSVRSIEINTMDLEKQCIQLDAFEKMNNLSLIKFFDGHRKCSYSSFSEDTPISFKHLRHLEWYNFPWRRMSNDMANVVVIKLLYNRTLEILWEGFKNLKKLKILDVSCSESLTRTGSFIGLENLEELDLGGCINLKEVDSSIVYLEKLKRMTFYDCKNIKSIPNLPEGIEEVNGAGCETLVCLPSNMSDLRSLKKLSLNKCVNLRPESLMKVTRLRNLQVLRMSNCNVSHVSIEIGNLVSLRELDLSVNTFSNLPDSFSNLSKLVELFIDDCSELQYLPLLPSNLGKITATGCPSLDVMPYDSMRMAYIFYSKMFKESLFTKTMAIGLSGKGIPDWCSTITYKQRRNVLSFDAPVYPDKKICGAILFSHRSMEHIQPTIFNKTKDTSHSFNNLANSWGFAYFNNCPSTCIYFYPLNVETVVVEAGDTVELHYEKSDRCDRDILSCGLSLIYEGDVVDSALVIQNRNVTHERTFPVPSEMNAAASITQLTDKVCSFSVLDNGCVYNDFFS